MITVTKTIRFDAAHVLTNHQGLCKNLHGHTYRVDVSVAQGDGDTRDMVIDFKDLNASRAKSSASASTTRSSTTPRAQASAR